MFPPSSARCNFLPRLARPDSEPLPRSGIPWDKSDFTLSSVAPQGTVFIRGIPGWRCGDRLPMSPMSSTLSQLNRKFPFDVLGLILSHYAVEETIHYPLETLLVVCQGWKEAALGHCALWNELNIYCTSGITLPRRYGMRVSL
jgi:hypothetical protein